VLLGLLLPLLLSDQAGSRLLLQLAAAATGRCCMWLLPPMRLLQLL